MLIPDIITFKNKTMSIKTGKTNEEEEEHWMLLAWLEPLLQRSQSYVPAEAEAALSDAHNCFWASQLLQNELSEFDPFGPIKFEKSRRAAQ